MTENFQDGCNTIVAGCTTYGSTPTSNSPSDIVNAIQKVYTAGQNAVNKNFQIVISFTCNFYDSGKSPVVAGRGGLVATTNASITVTYKDKKVTHSLSFPFNNGTGWYSLIMIGHLYLTFTINSATYKEI